jgi:hypothetical protein
VTDTINRFFANGLRPTYGSQARSAPTRNTMDQVQRGFRLVQEELDALRRGASMFTNLGDAPASIAGQALHYLRVNAAATAIEAVPPGILAGVRTISAGTYTLTPADSGWLLLFSAPGGCTVTVAEDAAASDYPETMTVLLAQWGAGRVTVAPAAGVTVSSSDGLMSSRTTFSVLGLSHLGGQAWLLSGDRQADAEGCVRKVANISGSRVLAAADDGWVLRCTAATTVTIPAGLDPAPLVVIIPPATGGLSWALAGGVTVNGSSTAPAASTRTAKPSGVVLTPYPEANAYALS